MKTNKMAALKLKNTEAQARRKRTKVTSTLKFKWFAISIAGDVIRTKREVIKTPIKRIKRWWAGNGNAQEVR